MANAKGETAYMPDPCLHKCESHLVPVYSSCKPITSSDLYLSYPFATSSCTAVCPNTSHLICQSAAVLQSVAPL